MGLLCPGMPWLPTLKQFGSKCQNLCLGRKNIPSTMLEDKNPAFASIRPVSRPAVRNKIPQATWKKIWNGNA